MHTPHPRRRVHCLALLVALVLVFAGCSSGDLSSDDAAGAPETTTTTERTGESTTTSAAVETLDAAQPGPFSVGRRTVSVVDPERVDRTLTVDIWYPTDAADGARSTYSFAPGIEYDSAVALDDPAVSSGGPFPLVVYSHGSGGLRYVASYFTERLASHGVVVVAPDHAGNTTIDQFLGTSDTPDVISRNRPLDVSAVISATIDGSVAPDIAAALDPDRIGVAGHSFGGYTALAIGGGVGDTPADARVSALVAMAPAAGRLADTELAAIDVPTLVLSGTLDTITPIEPNTVRTVELVAGRPLLRIDLVGATHQSFTDVCDYTVLLRELPDVGQEALDLVDEQADRTCDPDVLDVEQAQDLVNRYAISFLLAELTGDPAAAAALDASGAPDTVVFELID